MNVISGKDKKQQIPYGIFICFCFFDKIEEMQCRQFQWSFSFRTFFFYIFCSVAYACKDYHVSPSLTADSILKYFPKYD